MRYAEKARFSTEKVKRLCKDSKTDFALFASECELLEGKEGTYNRWLDFTQGKCGYDFEDDLGKYHFVPAEIVEQED